MEGGRKATAIATELIIQVRLSVGRRPTRRPPRASGLESEMGLVCATPPGFPPPIASSPGTTRFAHPRIHAGRARAAERPRSHHRDDGRSLGTIDSDDASPPSFPDRRRTADKSPNFGPPTPGAQSRDIH